METVAVFVCFGLFVLSLLKNKYTLYAAILLFLSRTDMSIFILFGYIWLYFNSINKKKVIKEFVYFIGAILLYFIFNYITTSYAMQTSGLVYPEQRWNEVSSIVTYFSKAFESLSFSIKQIGDWHGHIILFLFVLLYSWNKIPNLIKYLIFGGVSYFLFHNCFRFFFNTWYIGTYFLLFIICLSFIFEKSKEKFYILIAILIIAQGLLFYSTNKDLTTSHSVFHVWKAHNRPLDQIAASQYLIDKGYDGYFGAYNSGEFSYYGKKVINLDCLMNVEFYKQRDSALQYLRENNIYFIIDKPAYFNIFTEYIPVESLNYKGEIQHKENIEFGHPTIIVQVKP